MRSAQEEIEDLRQLLAERDREVADLRQTLAGIHASRLWSLAHRFWSFRRLLRRIVTGPEVALPTPTPQEPAPPAGQRAATPPWLAPRPGYDVVCFPIIDWEFRFQRPQQLLSRLADRGHRVFYLAQRLRRDGPAYELRQLRDGVYEVSLRGPARSVYTDALSVDDCAKLFGSLDALRRDLGVGPALALVQLPFWWPLARRAWQEFSWPVVYDCMDHHAGFSTNRADMLDHEAELRAQARLVVVTSPALLEECRARDGRVLLLRNAADYEHFAAVAAPRDHPPRARAVIGYYGAIAEWFDADLVADLAARRPDWDFVLVGSTIGAEVGRLAASPNVRLVGEQPYSSLPAWLDRFDALILPFRRLPLTEATNPVKAYEILASGRPLVSVPLPEMVTMSPLVRIAATAEEFEREIQAALQENPGAAEARRAFARENTWEQRLQLLDPALRQTFPRVSVVIVTIDNLALNRLCLDSLYANTAWPHLEVVVVDNGSSDGTTAFLEEAQRRHEDLQIVLHAENLGFPAASNAGLRRTTGDIVVLLNNDTVLTRGWLSALVRHLRRDPRTGIVGPVTNAIGNEAQVPVAYERLEELPGWAAAYTRQHDGEAFEIPMLAMFCVAMRREVYESIGPLDEQFGIGMFEDDDYSRRVRAAGYRVVCVEDSFVHHWQRSSFARLPAGEYQRIFDENRRRFEAKWGEPWRRHQGRGGGGAWRPATAGSSPSS